MTAGQATTSGQATTVVIKPYGPRALLVETGGQAAAAFALRAAALSGVIDVVVGARTVLVTYDPGGRDEQAAAEHYAAALRGLRIEADEAGAGTHALVIPVRYDGEDLAYVAAELGTDADGVIKLHSGAEYRVGFMGFAPGFGYLEGLPEPLRLPRRPTPRTRVPAGSLAIAGEYSAIYPGASPGGWLLLGHTSLRLFDPKAQPPALLSPGLRVRFDPQ